MTLDAVNAATAALATRSAELEALLAQVGPKVAAVTDAASAVSQVTADHNASLASTGTESVVETPAKDAKASA